MAGPSLARPRPDSPPPTTPAPDGSTPRALVVFAVAVAYVGVCILWGLFLARQALLLVYLSALLAIGVAPLVRVLQGRRLRRGGAPLGRTAAVSIVYLVSLAVGIAIAIAVVPTIVGQAQAFVEGLPALVEQAQQWLVAHGVLRRTMSVQDLMREAPIDTGAMGTVVTTVWGLVGGVFGVVTIVVLSFYLLIETDAIFRVFIRSFPRGMRPQVREIAHEITRKVSGWLTGQVLVAGIIGGTAAVGLALLGVPYFFVLGIIAAFGELIPYAGPLLAAIPAVGVASTVSWKLAVATAAFFFAQQQFENHVIVPRMMSNQVGLSSVAVIVALLLGASIFGLVGAILAVPTAAIAQVLFFELVSPGDE